MNRLCLRQLRRRMRQRGQCSCLPEDSRRTGTDSGARHDAFLVLREGGDRTCRWGPCKYGFLGRAVHDYIASVTTTLCSGPGASVYQLRARRTISGGFQVVPLDTSAPALHGRPTEPEVDSVLCQCFEDSLLYQSSRVMKATIELCTNFGTARMAYSRDACRTHALLMATRQRGEEVATYSRRTRAELIRWNYGKHGELVVHFHTEKHHGPPRNKTWTLLHGIYSTQTLCAECAD